MRKLKIYGFVIFLSILGSGCAELRQDSGSAVSVVKQAPGKNCTSLGEFSSSSGSGPYQLKTLKYRVAEKGANIVIIKSQKPYYRKQISGTEITTVIEAYRCS